MTTIKLFLVGDVMLAQGVSVYYFTCNVGLRCRYDFICLLLCITDTMSTIKLFLVGDVMLARGVDMIQEFSCDPKLYEHNGLSAHDYVQLAVMKNGPIPEKNNRGTVI